MAILIGILTAALVVLCLFLILLVLVQLPKKEAGASMAFGGGAADALLGAGSGSDIARFTGYVAGAFFVLTLTLSLLRAHEVTAKNSAVTDALRNVSGISFNAAEGGRSPASGQRAAAAAASFFCLRSAMIFS